MGMVQTNWRDASQRDELGDRAVPIVGTPISQMLVRSPRLDHFHDPEAPALAGRIRRIVDDARIDADAAVPMATMYRAANLGPLRTFSGGLAHENGWLAVHKCAGLAHWEGMAQRALVIRCQSDHAVHRVRTESLALGFVLDGEKVRYTIDVETIAADGAITVYEVKRDENDLANAAYRLKLAMVAEILRRCDISFRIIFRDEIFRNRIHEANAEMFAARAFTTIRREHVERIENHYARVGAETTLGALREALEPGMRNAGMALLQAFTVRRRVEIDLTGRLTADTPLTIH